MEKLCNTIERDMSLCGEATVYYLSEDTAEMSDLWDLRKKGVGLLGNLPCERKPLAFVEDTTVPPEHLAEYIHEFRQLLEKYGLEDGIFGHIDLGCMCIRPALDLKDLEQEGWPRKLSDQVRDLAVKYGVVMWAEQGRGFPSEYTVDFFGEELSSQKARKIFFIE